MRKIGALLVCLIALQAEALEYSQLFENDQICMALAKISPHEEISLHRDVYPAVVVALKGGVITRLEADGRVVDVNFPTGIAVFREADPENEFHRSFNHSDNPIELMIVQLKNSATFSKKKDPQSCDISIDIKINCPMSDGVKDFFASIPSPDRNSVNFEEWKMSFVNSMNSLIHLIENTKVYNAFWSVKTDGCLVQNIEGN